MPGLDFLEGANAPDLAAPVVSDTPAEAITVEAEAPGPVRGPDGRFASPTEAPEAPVQAQTPEPASIAPQPAPEPQHAPLTALLDERDKRQKAERELEQYRQQQRQQPPAEPEVPPDPYEDPEGYHQFVQQQIASATLNTRLDISEEMTRGKHGDALVDQARDWGMARMGQSPAFRQEVLSHRNPYEFLVQQHQRDTLVSSLQGDELDQFRAWKASQGQGALQPAPAPQPVPIVTPQAPRSLASATSAGGAGVIPVGPGQAFDGVFSQG